MNISKHTCDFTFNVRVSLGFFHSRFFLPDKLNSEKFGCDLTDFFIWNDFFFFQMRPEEEEVVTLEDLDTKDLINEEQKNAKNLVCLRCDSKILPKNMGAYQTDTEKSLHVMHKKQAQ